MSLADDRWTTDASMKQARMDEARRDEVWMAQAIAEAERARDLGEVPVGAVLVLNGQVVARGHNRTLTDVDPTAHAEVVTLRRAAQELGNHRTGGDLYVTLEPCLLCMGAAVQARIDRLVYAASDPKAGAAESLYRIGEDSRLNHRFSVQAGVLADEGAALLSDFFRARRAARKRDLPPGDVAD